MSQHINPSTLPIGSTNSRFARVPEPELMLEAAQAVAYAAADFEEAHSAYPRLFKERFPGFPRRAAVLDLGCGPCDVTWRFARLSADWRIDAVDGSPAMLAEAKRTLVRHRIQQRVRLIQGLLSDLRPPRKRYNVILATNLLHHLPDASALWTSVRTFAKPGALVFVADLRRPRTRREARRLEDRYAAHEPQVLRRDFYNSLLASFTPEEVGAQLAEACLENLTVTPLDDRHLLVFGRQP